MLLKKVFIAACAFAWFCGAQAINIRGSVIDNASAPISGAMVKLEAANISATSGPDGSFRLEGTLGIRPKNNLNLLEQSPIALHRGQIRISLSEKALVTTCVRNVSGGWIFRSKQIYDAGTHIMPSNSSGTGIHLYQVTIGQDNYTFKSSPLGSFSCELQRVSSSLSRKSPSKQAKASGGFRDIISATMQGQLNFSDSIRTPDTAGIVITMIPNAGNVTDADGNVYQSVRIGNQVWTTENLKTTKYNDGTPIPRVTDSLAWNNLTTGAYCYYGNYTAKNDKFGAMYNWYAVQTHKLAPMGWHVPTIEELNTLITYLILKGYNWGGTTLITQRNKLAKSLAAKTDWAPNNTIGAAGNEPSSNNATGFSALPGGWRRLYSGKPEFTRKGSGGYWWSSTEDDDESAKCYVLGLIETSLGLNDCSHHKEYGISVRLIRDN